ncbi:MAG: SPOR domain-containing protein [Alphaproteobacteria bacterium]
MTQTEPPFLVADAPTDRLEHVAAGPRRRSSRERALWVAGIAAVLGAGVLWVALPGERAVPAPDEVPLVKADPEPTKVRPEDPGGLAIPDQDKLVYGLIDPTAQDGEVVERLLPPPEEPVMVEPAAPEPVVEEAEDAIADALTGAESSVEAGEPAPEALAEVAPAAGAEDIVAAIEPAPEAGATGHVWRVQVGAVKELAQVDPEWARLKKKLGALMEGLAITVETADLGSEQGLYHRLQVGAFAERDGADGLCKKFKALKVDCLVVRR